MTDPISLALSRLSQAIDRLDAVSLRHGESERVRATLEIELAVMREDRHKLTVLLDQERMERISTEAQLADIVPRIDRAMQSIRQSLPDQ